jgi:TRAP-type uncharacterized transport system substrate-binding protein
MRRMLDNKRFVLLGAITILLTLMIGTTPSMGAEKKEHEKVRIPILALPMGAGVYEWWATFERIFEENHPWLRIAAQETPGFVYNIQEMANNKKRWKECMFGTSLPVTEAAKYGLAPFFKKPIPTKPFKYVYPTAGCGLSTWVWVTLDPNIKTMKDFEGKRLGLGLRGQINWGLWPTVATQTLGIKAKLEYLGPFPAVDALLDGRVQAAQINAYFSTIGGLKPRPLAALQKIVASGRKFYYVSYDNNWIQRAKTAKGYLLAQPWDINPGELPNLDRKVVGIQARPAGWAVHESFPDELAYEFTKFMIVHGKKLAKYSKIGDYFDVPKKFFVPVFGFTNENTHPSSIKAFKEYGLWD